MTLGGWQVNGVLRAQNGNLVATPGASSTSGGNVTPLSSPRLGNATYGRYFNTCYQERRRSFGDDDAYALLRCDSTSSIPAFQQHLSFTLNNIGPYMNDVRQRVHPLFDFTLFKQFQLHESLNFEIRGEFFNILNTPNFGGPNTIAGIGQLRYRDVDTGKRSTADAVDGAPQLLGTSNSGLALDLRLVASPPFSFRNRSGTSTALVP